MINAMITVTQPYAKCFILFESDFSMLSDFMYDLGISFIFALMDVVSIENSILLSVISRFVFAFILVLPISDEYERHRRKITCEIGEDPIARKVFWFRQIIDNACGLYAILHAICNFGTKAYISMLTIYYEEFFALTESHGIKFNFFLNKLCICLNGDRKVLFNESTDLETMYRKAAIRGSTSFPPVENEIDLHYVCFFRFPNGSIYEMDGDANGPVKTNIMLKQNKNMLDASALECVKRCIVKGGADMNFSLLALVPNLGNSD